MPSKKDKPRVVTFKKGALDSFAPEEREKIQDQISKLFENNDPRMIGQRVEQIGKSATSCPRCGGPLVDLVVTAGMLFVDCGKCDTAFCRPIDA